MIHLACIGVAPPRLFMSGPREQSSVSNSNAGKMITLELQKCDAIHSYDVSFQVIVLAPTRELVNQVANDFKALKSTFINIQAFYGGVSMHAQGTVNS